MSSGEASYFCSSTFLPSTDIPIPTSTRPRASAIAARRSLDRYLTPSELPEVDTRIVQYPNGLRLVSEKVARSSSLALGLWVNVGSRDEAKRQAGIAHFIEHIVFKGTTGKSMREIMRSIESRGGFLNAFTTKEHTCYYTWTRSLHLPHALDVLFDLASRPTFTKRDIEREKLVIMEEIHGIEEEGDELAFDHFEKEIFGEHPLGRPVLGTVKSVGSLTQRDVLSFHKRHYRARDMVLVASGAHEHEDIIRSIDFSLKHLAHGTPRVSPKAARFPRRTKSEQSHTRAGGQQAHIIFGRRTIGIKSKKSPAVNTVVTLLGSGMSSRLNLRLREELGLAYDASAFYSPFADTGAVGLYVASTAENQARAIRELKKIVRGLFTRKISQSELERTKDQLIGSMLLSLESITSRMMRTGQNHLYFNRYVTLEEELERYALLSLREVRQMAEELFEDESGLTLVSVVPEREPIVE